MTLGNNRDYKTTDRRARKQLKIHEVKMKNLMDKGYTREKASILALKEMEGVMISEKSKNNKG